MAARKRNKPSFSVPEVTDARFLGGKESKAGKYKLASQQEDIDRLNAAYEAQRLNSIQFSFRYFHEDEKRDMHIHDKANTEWLQKFLLALTEISKRSRQEFETNRGIAKHFHYHPIKEKLVPFGGFGVSTPPFAIDEAHQFAVTAGLGRIHGFWHGGENNLFHVVWIDLDHSLYPGE